MRTILDLDAGALACKVDSVWIFFWNHWYAS